MKSWHILHDTNYKKELKPVDIVKVLLQNRGIDFKNSDDFFNPKISDINLQSIGIEESEFQKFTTRIIKAIKDKERIIIFGDYDVDGICASAILWETLFAKTDKVSPYIPDRVDEGYGLSVKGIDNVLEKFPETKIIITVDNGIVAYDAVSYSKTKGIDVMITDHHVRGEKLPDAYCILHTTALCGAGIAWVVASLLEFEQKSKIEEKIELAALATVADLVPLVGPNRAIVKSGLEILRKTKRPGLIELLREAAIDKSSIGVYAIGHIIAPRINASGRIQSAMNALRLLCTNNIEKAKMLSSMLSDVNRDRQDLTEEAVEHAKLLALESTKSSRITVVAHESYNQGIIGLVASRLVESYYKPSFAIAKGEKISKGSARSIVGVNIIELIRSVSSTIIEAGGHPMAAGFSVATNRIEEFTEALSRKADEIITDNLLKRTLNIDMLLPFSSIDEKLVAEIQKLEPYGMANSEPVFATKGVTIGEVRKIGRDQNHLKMKLEKEGKVFDAIGFRFAEKVDVSPGDIVDVAYTVDENEWNGRVSLQLKIRDILI
ncbi:MAG: single-stranded-DNA-specific exonuclease RecJ [Candidatus Levybacteria bacterium]|nr:single-stranded-DNA-specific exonuclease RecJ [Candidatus Levybacteria bacterium]